ncbi:MAG TPA: outer membrane lipoprotein carrier protein LolA [Bacteroidales bacterium]|nr:outer membrane lipoprotein carrier protein LolA [Bacteroidales bacterium]
MMKRFLMLLLLLGAMINSREAAAQKTADQLLKSTVDKIRATPNLKIEFSYQMINTKAGINEKKSGTLFLNGDAYKVLIDGQTIVSDGKTVWTYLPGSNEVMVSNAGVGEESLNPTNLLTSYSKDYKASFTNDKTNTAKGLKTIELKAGAGSKFPKVLVGVKEAAEQLGRLVIFDNGGNQFIYDLSGMTPNASLTRNFFTFNPADYPGIDVVDMR